MHPCHSPFPWALRLTGSGNLGFSDAFLKGNGHQQQRDGRHLVYLLYLGEVGLEGGHRPVPQGLRRIAAPGTEGQGIPLFALAKMPLSISSRSLVPWEQSTTSDHEPLASRQSNEDKNPLEMPPMQAKP